MDLRRLYSRIKWLSCLVTVLCVIICVLIVFQVTNPLESELRNQVILNLKKQKDKEGLFVDYNDKLITDDSDNVELGQDRKCLYPVEYGFVLGFNDAIYCKSSFGLRPLYEDILWNKDNSIIKLTTENELQRSAYNTLENMGTRSGSVVVLENGTGRIRAIASRNKVELDLNDIDTFMKATENINGSRDWLAISDLKPPGSTWKPIVAGAALDSRSLTNKDFLYNDVGGYQTSNFTVQNYAGIDYGYLGDNIDEILNKAFANSINTYFCHLGNTIGASQLSEVADKLLFNQKISLDLGTIYSHFELENNDFDIAQTSIGQGKMLVSPLSLCMMFQIFSSDGNMLKPYLIEEISANEKLIYQSKTEVLSRPFSRKTISKIQSALHFTAVNAYGFDESLGYVIAKSGTAETAEGVQSYMVASNEKYTICISCSDLNNSTELYAPMYELLSEFR